MIVQAHGQSVNKCVCSSSGGLSLVGATYLYVSCCHVSVSPWPLDLLLPKSSDRTILPLYSHSPPSFRALVKYSIMLWYFHIFFFLLSSLIYRGHEKKQTSNDLICGSIKPIWLICLVSCWSSSHFEVCKLRIYQRPSSRTQGACRVNMFLSSSFLDH